MADAVSYKALDDASERVPERSNDLPERSKRHFRMGLWLLLLTANWILVKGQCSLGLPTKCAKGWDMVRSLASLQSLLL